MQFGIIINIWVRREFIVIIGIGCDILVHLRKQARLEATLVSISLITLTFRGMCKLNYKIMFLEDIQCVVCGV
jgi:hypothetical protein